MTGPEEALELARRAVEERRAAGGYAESSGPAAEELSRPGEVPPELLREWALLSVDPELVYSTRRVGAPITLLKRVLLRLMRQYTLELEARQTRFNVALLSRLAELEGRLERLERDSER